MSDRPDVHRDNVLSIAQRYGDACVKYDRILRPYRIGDDRAELDNASKEIRELYQYLGRVARQYATNQRKKSKKEKQSV